MVKQRTSRKLILLVILVLLTTIQRQLQEQLKNLSVYHPHFFTSNLDTIYNEPHLENTVYIYEGLFFRSATTCKEETDTKASKLRKMIRRI